MSTAHAGGCKLSSVYLRVYDISAGAAKTWSPIVLGRRVEGVWHSGIEVFGYEYFYGGGIVKMRPENVETTFGISPTRVHHLGSTGLNRTQFEKHLLSIMSMFRRDVYDLANWNCNHFSDHCAKHLVDRHIPSYILDLPHEICKTFMGKIILNFIKMMQGGAAPITIDDPSHPSRVQDADGDSACTSAPDYSQAKLRRNSCPASPTRSASASRTHVRDRIAPPCANPNTARDSIQSQRQANRRRAQTMSSDSAMCRSPSDSNLSYADRASSASRNRYVSFRTRDEIFGGGDELQTVKGAPIGHVDTNVSFSPKHRRLYEMECDRFVCTKRSRQRVRVSDMVKAPPRPRTKSVEAASAVV